MKENGRPLVDIRHANRRCWKVSLSKGRYRNALNERSQAMDSTSGTDLDDM